MFLWIRRRIPSRRSLSRRALPEWVKKTYSGASLHYRRLSLRSAQSLRCSLTLRASTISPIEKPQLQRTSARGEHCGETHKGTTTLSAIREACLGSHRPTNSGKTVVTRNLLSLVKVADKLDKSLLVCYRSIAHQGNVALMGGADVSQRIQGAVATVGFWGWGVPEMWVQALTIINFQAS